MEIATMFQQIGLKQILDSIKNPPKLKVKASEDEKSITLWVYGEIGTETNSEDVARMVESFPREKPILVRINSMGGYVHDGLAIYSALKQRKNVITRIDGIAASAASVIAMAGNPVQVFPHSQIFIHRASLWVSGNSKVLRHALEWLEKIDNSIASIYANKTGKDIQTIESFLDGDYDGTIFSAEDAMKNGFADVLLSEEQSTDVEATNKVSIPTNIEDNSDDVPKNFVPNNPPNGDGEGVEGEWEKPNLSDFTDKGWDELSVEERRRIASYYGFAISLDRFEDLKLPHHFPPNHENAGKASLDGVRNALARLPQTEGISEEDRGRIEAHLRAHLPKEDSEDEEREILALLVSLFS